MRVMPVVGWVAAILVRRVGIRSEREPFTVPQKRMSAARIERTVAVRG